MIAWRDLGCLHRRAAFEYVRAHVGRLLGHLPGYLVIAAAEPFTKARALNRAIIALPAETVVVQLDADSFLKTSATGYRVAIEFAAEDPGLVVPHTHAVYLSEKATERILAGAQTAGFLEGEIVPASVGCVTVFSRQTWELAGGYDERFGLWGGDDAAFAYACGALAGEQRRLGGDVLHLHHPRPAASTPGTPGYLRQAVILDQYRDAEAAGGDALRALVEAR